MVQLLLDQERQLGQSLVGATRGSANPASKQTRERMIFIVRIHSSVIDRDPLNPGAISSLGFRFQLAEPIDKLKDASPRRQIIRALLRMREKLLGSGPETIDLRHISPVHQHRLSCVQVYKVGGFSSRSPPCRYLRCLA